MTDTYLDTSNCTSLAIDIEAFFGCTNLTSVDLSGCTSVGEKVFYQCTNITAVTWPTDTMKTIPSNCFSGCKNLKTFNSKTTGICDLTGITSIGQQVFNNCTSLTSANLYQCSFVGEMDFDGCTGLIPIISTKTTIESHAFRGCQYVTIQAASEADLESYCSDIDIDSDIARDLSDLAEVKKLASIPGVTDVPTGLSYDHT